MCAQSRLVEAAQARAHRQAHLLGHMRPEHDIGRVGDVARFGPEQQDVGRLVLDVRVQLGRMSRERDDARLGHRLDEVVEIRVQHHMRHVVVVQPGAAQLGVAQVEPQRLHKVQDRAGHRAQADRRPGVAGDARRVIAQVRGRRLHRGRGLGREHRVDDRDRVAVRVGHQFVGAVIRLAVAVFEHLLHARLGRGIVCIRHAVHDIALKRQRGLVHGRCAPLE